MLNLNETAKKIGRNISNFLIERDKTQQELADAIGVSKSTVFAIQLIPEKCRIYQQFGDFSLLGNWEM